MGCGRSNTTASYAPANTDHCNDEQYNCYVATRYYPNDEAQNISIAPATIGASQGSSLLRFVKDCDYLSVTRDHVLGQFVGAPRLNYGQLGDDYASRCPRRLLRNALSNTLQSYL
jgi:hypothetical protein